MKKLIGKYNLGDLIMTGLVFIISCYLDYIFIHYAFIKGGASAQDTFTLIFMEIILLIVMFIPIISHELKGVESEKINNFLDLPDKNQPFKFTDVSDFFSNLALAAFLLSVATLTTKSAFMDYGPIAAAAYAAILYVSAVTIGAISVIRLILHFVQKWYLYALVSISSFSLMLAFLHIGALMGKN